MMKEYLKKLLKGLAVALSLGITTTFIIGCSDREGAEEELKKRNLTVVEYEGKPGFFDSGRRNLYNDKFRVVSGNNKDTMEVVVSKGLYNRYTLTFR